MELYHEILHLRQYYMGIQADHDEQFHNWERLHPFKATAVKAEYRMSDDRLNM